MTIPYFGGSLVAYLPLKNATRDSQAIIDAAAAVSPRAVLPKDIDSTLVAGYEAQASLTLDLYRSLHATVQEVAWAGGNTVCVAMLKPLSRGTITINSTDATKPPTIDFRTFSHPIDFDVTVASLKKTREFMSSGPMRAIGAVEIVPGANITSDAEIEAAIRTFVTGTWQHPTSTCSMMPRELGGVVDPQLQVYGVKGLRIVDASIMPMIIGSHTSSTVYAVAEKVSFAS